MSVTHSARLQELEFVKSRILACEVFREVVCDGINGGEAVVGIGIRRIPVLVCLGLENGRDCLKVLLVHRYRLRARSGVVKRL